MAGYPNKDETWFLDLHEARHFIVDDEDLMSGPTERTIKDHMGARWRPDDRPVSVQTPQFSAVDSPGWNADADLGLSLGTFRPGRRHATDPKTLSCKTLSSNAWSLKAPSSRRPSDFIGARALRPTRTAFNAEAWKRVIKWPGTHSLAANAERYR